MRQCGTKKKYTVKDGRSTEINRVGLPIDFYDFTNLIGLDAAVAEINAFEGERILGQENENEDILVNSYSIQEVKELLKDKKINNGVTLLALQWFFLEYYKY